MKTIILFMTLALIASSVFARSEGTPNFWDYYNDGLAAQRSNNIERALEYYLEAQKLYPKQYNVNLNIGLCYRKLNDFNKAIDFLEKAKNIDPANPSSYRELGEVYFQINEKLKAKENFIVASTLLS